MRSRSCTIARSFPRDVAQSKHFLVAPHKQFGYSRAMRLSELLDLWMKNHKVSVRVLAKELGMDHTVLHRFRHGEDCTNRTLAKVLVWALENVHE